ncbi:hypothetical protein NLJ89_g10493 [Agrocybe chaxingu]|uniref:Uncharacterized protein n=1 Tax=Agrocybe chaxingu TaxID=84603 RepID=A0A9W8MSK7_9AGAR|nr:hypothetical protein NLJ89_g10493 [Agrocybe chaxingu]
MDALFIKAEGRRQSEATCYFTIFLKDFRITKVQPRKTLTAIDDSTMTVVIRESVPTYDFGYPGEPLRIVTHLLESTRSYGGEPHFADSEQQRPEPRASLRVLVGHDAAQAPRASSDLNHDVLNITPQAQTCLEWLVLRHAEILQSLKLTECTIDVERECGSSEGIGVGVAAWEEHEGPSRYNGYSALLVDSGYLDLFDGDDEVPPQDEDIAAYYELQETIKLLDAIFSEIDSKQTLSNLRLTSKVFREIATPYAFRTFDIPIFFNPKKFVVDFWEALDLAKHVQEVKLDTQDLKGDEVMTDLGSSGYMCGFLNVLLDRLPFPDTMYPGIFWGSPTLLRLYLWGHRRPDPGWEDPEYQTSHSYRLESEVCRAVASSKLVDTVQTLEIRYLLPCNPVLRHFDSPSSLLTSLTIAEWFQSPSLGPLFWESVTYPRLQHLHLETVSIKTRDGPSDVPRIDLETFLLRYAGSLKTVKLHNCLIAGIYSDGEPPPLFPRTWGDVWDTVTEILPHLMRFDFEPVPRNSSDDDPSSREYYEWSYGFYHSEDGYCSMLPDEWDAAADSMPCEQDDRVAWDILQRKLEERRKLAHWN